MPSTVRTSADEDEAGDDVACDRRLGVAGRHAQVEQAVLLVLHLVEHREQAGGDQRAASLDDDGLGRVEAVGATAVGDLFEHGQTRLEHGLKLTQQGDLPWVVRRQVPQRADARVEG